MSTLRLAEWTAGELITACLALMAGIWAWRRWRQHAETPADDRERQETTQFSSMQDD